MICRHLQELSQQFPLLITIWQQANTTQGVLEFPHIVLFIHCCCQKTRSNCPIRFPDQDLDFFHTCCSSFVSSFIHCGFELFWGVKNALSHLKSSPSLHSVESFFDSEPTSMSLTFRHVCSTLIGPKKRKSGPFLQFS